MRAFFHFVCASVFFVSISEGRKEARASFSTSFVAVNLQCVDVVLSTLLRGGVELAKNSPFIC